MKTKQETLQLATEFKASLDALLETGILSKSYIKAATSAANFALRTAREQLLNEMIANKVVSNVPESPLD